MFNREVRLITKKRPTLFTTRIAFTLHTAHILPKNNALPFDVTSTHGTHECQVLPHEILIQLATNPLKKKA